MEAEPLRIVVMGGGYVGLPTAAALSARGHLVTVVDVPQRVRDLVSTRSVDLDRGAWRDPWPAEENIRERCKHVVIEDVDSTLAVTALKDADITVACVPVMNGGDGQDLYILNDAADRWATHNRGGVFLVKSTVAPGTTADLLSTVIPEDRSGDVGMWPEFLAEGTAMADADNPSRSVVGWVGQPTVANIGRVMRALSGDRPDRMVFTDSRTAEATKYVANVMLAARLTLANELALMAVREGADGREAVRIAGLDPRIGSQYLSPGAGWGGSCFPKDVRAAAEWGDSALIASLLTANQMHTRSGFDLVAMAMTQRAGPIAWLGLAFKAGTNDTRSSPAIDVLMRTIAASDMDQRIGLFDAVAVAPKHVTEVRKVEQHSRIEHALHNAEIVVVATDWDSRRLAAVAKLWAAHPPIVVDLRGSLDPADFEGWADLRQFGRPSP